MNRLVAKVLFLFFIPHFLAQAETLNFGVRSTVKKTGNLEVLALVEAAGERVGHKVNYRTFPTKRSLKLASIGELDGEMLRHTVIESFYPTLIRVNEAIDWFDYWVWIPQDKECVPSHEELSLLKPAGLKGVAFYQTKIYPLSEAGYVEVSDDKQLFSILSRGRADYTVQSKKFMETLNVEQPLKFKICFNEPLFSLPFFLYLHESNQHLVSPFEQAIRAVKLEKKFHYSDESATANDINK